MICKRCRNEIPDGSLFCNYCGASQIRRRSSRSAQISIPEPVQLRSGKWHIQIRDSSGSHSFTDTDKNEVVRLATAYRLGLLNEQNSPRTLSKAIDLYLARKQNLLSPTTVRDYKQVQAHRFKRVMNRPLSSRTDWQRVINDEAALVSPVTLKGAWLMVCAVLRAEGITPPAVLLPSVQKKQPVFLDYEQIERFLPLIRGDKCELGALLALHGLRSSEIRALTWDDVNFNNRIIYVHDSLVLNADNKFVLKGSNKNVSSTRYVAIQIPRLYFLLQAIEPKTGFLVQYSETCLRKHINSICLSNDLPPVGIHGLRHSFASLAYHLRLSEAEAASIGGWANVDTMRSIYTHLAEKDKLLAEHKLVDFYTSSQAAYRASCLQDCLQAIEEYRDYAEKQESE